MDQGIPSVRQGLPLIPYAGDEGSDPDEATRLGIIAMAVDKGVVMEACPFTSKPTIEELSPTNAGLLEEQQLVGGGKIGRAVLLAMEPGFNAIEQESLKGVIHVIVVALLAEKAEEGDSPDIVARVGAAKDMIAIFGYGMASGAVGWMSWFAPVLVGVGGKDFVNEFHRVGLVGPSTKCTGMSFPMNHVKDVGCPSVSICDSFF